MLDPSLAKIVSIFNVTARMEDDLKLPALSCLRFIYELKILDIWILEMSFLSLARHKIDSSDFILNNRLKGVTERFILLGELCHSFPLGFFMLQSSLEPT